MNPDTQPHKARVYLVDDHPILRQGLVLLISAQADMEICGEASVAQDALRGIADLAPDIAIVDISLEGMNGIELIRVIKQRQHSLRVLVLSMHDESLYAERALRGGADGYIMKAEPPEAILAAVRQVLNGDVFLSARMSKRILREVVGVEDHAASPMDRLTDRELEVFVHISQGLGTRQIAERLHVSIKTVESHRANIRERLALQDGNELLRYAIEWARIQPSS